MKTYTRVVLLGNLAADPECRQTKSGKSVVNFPIATNRPSTDESGNKIEIADFHRIVAWNGLSQICEKHLAKGMPVLIEGRLINHVFDDHEGHKHFRTEIVADSLRILGWKKSKAGRDGVTIETVTAEEDQVEELVPA